MPGTNLTRTEARERAALVSVSSYDVDLDLTTGEETFASTTTVRFSCADPGASTFIDLIAPRVRSVLLNGRRLDPAEVADGARIRLDDLASENELTVEADALYMNTGEGLHRFVDPVDKEVYLYSQFEVSDARRVFTCFDQPDLKATFAFTVTGPKHWRVISNSPTPQPEEVAGTGSATWRFAPTPRLSTYVTAIIAGPYEGATGELTSTDGRTIPLGVYCRASLAQYLDADELMHITRQGFGHYEDLFAVPYPFQKYDQVFVPEFNAGAMENAGAVTFLEGYVFRSKVPEAMVERRALTVLHELAHMWFGDLVTMRWWDDLWLNESFAEYTSTLCMVESTRWDRAWTTFSSMEKSWAYRQDQLPVDPPDRRRHPRPRGRRGQLRRHHLRQGRQRPEAAGRLRRPRRVRRGPAPLLRQARVGQHRAEGPAGRAGGDLRARPRLVVGAVAREGRHHHAAAAGRDRGRDDHRAVGRAGDARGAPGPASAPARGVRLRPRRLRPDGAQLADRARRRRAVHRRPRRRRQAAARPAAGQRRGPRVRQDPPRRRLDGHGRQAPRRLRRLAPPRPGVGGGVGHDPRRRDGAARLRRAGLREHRGRDRLLGRADRAAPARHDGEVLRPPRAPARGLRRRRHPAARRRRDRRAPAATCSCSW